MKRIIAALLALCVTAGTVSYPAGMHEAKAAEAREAGNAETDILNAESVSDFKYVELANGDLKIIKYKGNATELVIPPEVGGKKVVEIGAGAFRGCSRLESITISKNVKQIRYGEYDENDIYIALFSGCENLTEIIVEEGNAWYSSQEGILYDKDKTALLYCPEGKEGSITILSSIKTINEEIFRGCENLTDIVVDKDNRVYSSVEGILYSKNMTDLYCCPAGKQGSIVIPSGVTSIWSSAFRNCSSLTSIAIPQSVYSIMKDSFFGCSNLTDIVVDEKNECYSSLNGILYKKQSTNASSLTLVCCPEGKLGSIVIPDGVGAIEYMAFYNCMNLISIVIPKSVQYIGYGEETEESSAFKGCGNLTEIIVEEDNIGYRSVDGVLYRYVAGREALVCCPAGKQGRVDVQEGAMFLSSLAFQDCHGLTSITIPKSITRIYDDGGIIANAFKDCSNLEEIIVDEDSKSFSAQEGILYYDAGAILVCCPVGKQGSIVIPSGVTSIGDSAFRNCGSLTSITIPQSVEYIGEYSFFGCSNLTDIVVDKDNREYSSADGILYNKNMTYLNCCPAGKEGSIMIPDGTQSIGQRAFEGCVGLTEVSIPDSVDYIADEYLFDSCSDNICILCMPGSYAEAYARKHNINYTVILKKPQTITASNYTKTVGDAAFSIGASTDGDGVLSYQSSDESVVIVSSKGVAAVIGAGTAQVTIAAAETSEYEAAQKVITITVKPASGAGENPPPADLAGTSYDIGGCTYTITSTEPKEACFTSLNDDRTVVTIPNLVTINGSTYEVSSIAERACYGIEALQRVRVGANVKEIGAGAFAGCTAMEQAIVPESVQTIGEGAFAGCSEGLCMVCARGSAAEAYAVENGIRHKASADEKEPQTIMAGDFEKTFGDGPFPIGASTDGDGALSYESDNEAVAVVSAKGTVVLMGAGTARITIKASETENYGPAEKTIAVTVSPKPGGDQKPGGAQKPDAGGSSQEKPENKKAQTVTAADLAKTYGDRPFSIGAKSSGGGALSYVVKNPAVASVDGNGAVTLKCCGVTEIVITAAANGRYQAASKTITLTVAPKKLSGTSAKSTKAKTLTVKWKKDKAATGYIIECSTDKKFRKNVKTATVKKNKTVSKKLTNLKGGKRYYVRACAYVQAGGAKIKGAYRTVKKAVKVKK